MRIVILALTFSCLVVFSEAFPRAVEFNQPAAVRSVDDENENDQIVGGVAAKAGEFPFQAKLILSGSLCGGTLIAPSFVLTAAHCLYGLAASSASTFQVTINATSYSGGVGSITRSVRTFLIHESYNPNSQDNDVALLALSSPISTIKPVSLPPKGSNTTYAGSLATIAGWGTTSAGGRTSSVLLKAVVTVLTNDVCNKQYINYGGINNLKICAAAPGKDTCQGDSGGPLLVNGVQVGVTSYGIGCANSAFAGVYARVTSFVDWIAKTQASL